MKKLIFSLAFAAGMILNAHAGDPEKGELKVNPTTSKIEWTARKVTGKHNGTVGIKEGTLKIKDGILLGGNFTVDMTTIVVTDLTGEYKGKLEGHLKSADFFGVEKFPEASIKFTKVIPRGIPGEYKVTANLTIKGITKEIKFNASAKDGMGSASIKVDRSEFDIRYGSGSFFDNLGDKTIYDEFDLDINIKF